MHFQGDSLLTVFLEYHQQEKNALNKFNIDRILKKSKMNTARIDLKCLVYVHRKKHMDWRRHQSTTVSRNTQNLVANIRILDGGLLLNELELWNNSPDLLPRCNALEVFHGVGMAVPPFRIQNPLETAG